MLKQINLKYFMISFCVGILIVYVMKPPSQIVVKFPSPTNSAIKYKDNADNCYKYNAKEVECDKTAVSQPIIEEFKRQK
jgi:hypothetical protein